jgi:TolB-like protein/Tfp pilus assembly protein PilF
MGSPEDSVPHVDPQHEAQAPAAVAHPVTPEPQPVDSFWARIKRHKVVEWTLAYVAFGYALLHGVQMLRETFDWPFLVPRLTVFGLVLGAPIAVTLAWYHGHRAQHRVSGRELSILIALLVVAGSVLWWAARTNHERAKTAAVSAGSSAAEAAFNPPAHSIAVLPFVDMSEKHDQEYFADGMAEEIIDLLVRIPHLMVIGRTSSFQFKGKNTDLREVGKALGAAYVLEGSVRRSQDRIRVSVQLIEARDGAHRWSESYDRPIGDVIKVQDDIAAGLVRTIQVQVGAADLPGHATVVNPEAYELFLRARAARDRQDIQGQEDALGYYEQALKVDPTFVPAAIGLAYASVAIFNYTRTESDANQARAAIDAALRLDPSLAEMHSRRGWLYLNHGLNWAAAEAELTQALRMDQESYLVQNERGWLACALGRWDEAMRYFRAALSRDPFNPQAIFTSASCLLRSRQFVEAEEQIRHALAISPTDDPAWAVLGRVLLARGEPAAALDAFRHTTWRHNRLVGFTAAYYAMGRRAESDQAMRQLEAKAAAEEPYEVAEGRAYRGEIEEALKWLERAEVQKNVDMVVAGVKGDPAFAQYTGDPRYRAFLRKMNLPD